MDWIDRYISIVIRHVPQEQKAFVEKETREKIAALLEERRRDSMNGESDKTKRHDPDEADVRSVLETLGDPAAFAGNYHQVKRHVIGPAFFDTYWLVLRIVLVASGFGLLIAKSIQIATGAFDHILTAFADLFASLFQGLLSAFGLVTLIFFLVETFGNKRIESSIQAAKKPWRVEDLPTTLSEKLRIKRGDPIADIVFSLIFLVVINVFPQLFGFYAKTDTGVQITGFLGDALAKYLIWINIVIILGIALEAIKIAFGRWNWPIVFLGIVQTSLSLIIGLQVIRDPNFINPEFIVVFNRFLVEIRGGPGCAWHITLVTALTILVVFGFVVEMITLGVKAYQLAGQKRESNA